MSVNPPLNAVDMAILDDFTLVDVPTLDHYARLIGLCHQKGGGWNWREQELMKSFLRGHTLAVAYHLAEEMETYHQIKARAIREAASLIIGFDVKQVPIRFLYELWSRHLFLRLRYTQDPLASSFRRELTHHPVLPFIVDGLNSANRLTLSGLFHDAVTEICFFERVFGVVDMELLGRYHRQPKALQAVLNIVIAPSDEKATPHYREAMTHLMRITRNLHLPADFDDEKESLLDLLLAEQLRIPQALKAQNMGDLFQWIENGAQWVIPNMLQGVQKEIKKQSAHKRWADVIANKQYLGTMTEAGTTGQDGLACVAPPELTTVPSLTLREALSQEQIQHLQAAFGTMGAHVALAIYDHPDASNAELRTLVSDRLGKRVSQSTIEKYKKRFRDHGKVFRRIVEGDEST